jgi:sRNA-binding regulator protein Hfq
MLEILKTLSCVQILEEGRKKFNPEFVKKIKATEKRKVTIYLPNRLKLKWC